MMKFPTKLLERAPGSVINLICTAFVCFISTACAVDSRHLHSLDAILDIRNEALVINRHAKADGFEYCRSWQLDKEQIVAFFARATTITAEEKTMAYDWSPCSIDGIFDTRHDRNVRFSINAASFAEVRFEDGEVSYFGCKKRCSHIFDFGFY